MRTYLKLKHYTPAKALDLADGQWLNGDLYLDDKGVAFIAPHCEVEDFPAEDARPIDPRTICLQTNLLDSRGFPLYDRDAVLDMVRRYPLERLRDLQRLNQLPTPKELKTIPPTCRASTPAAEIISHAPAQPSWPIPPTNPHRSTSAEAAAASSA